MIVVGAVSVGELNIVEEMIRDLNIKEILQTRGQGKIRIAYTWCLWGECSVRKISEKELGQGHEEEGEGG